MKVFPLTLDDGNVINPDYHAFWSQHGWPTQNPGETVGMAMDRTIQEDLQRKVTQVWRAAGGGANVKVPLDVMTSKTIDLTDRRTITLPMKAEEAGAVTHLAFYSEEWEPRFALYRVTNLLTRTLSATSVTFEVELDPIGTVTMQTKPERPLKVGGYWDVFHRNLGERSKPYAQPMGIVDDLSVRLPGIPKWKYYSTLDPADLVFVKITGVKGGGFKTYGCLAFADPTVARAVLVSFDGTNSYYYPKIDDIVNDPQTYTPFDTADSILDISVSARSPVPILTVEGGTPLDLSVDVITSDTLVLDGDFVALGTGTLRYGWSELSDASYGLSQSYDVPATGGVSWFMWPVVEMDLRDMYGNVLANIDTGWCEPYGSEHALERREMETLTSVSGLRVVTSVTLTNVMSSLVFPDGSHIDWPEGHLPFNTSVYKDYLATQQRYDREMMDIAVQQARGQTIVNSATSLVNGVLTGALSANPLVGIATTVVGVAGNIAEYEIRSETLRKELTAKQSQLQLMPDKTFVEAGNIEYLDGFNQKLKGKAVDMITVKLPIDAWRMHPTAGVIYESRYVDWFIRHGFYAGGRFGLLDQDDTELYSDNTRFVKVGSVVSSNMFEMDFNSVLDKPFPGWLQRQVVDLLRRGVNLRRIQV